MTSSAGHIIRHQYMDVTYYGNESEAFSIQHQLAELSYEMVIPALEKAFNKCIPTDEYVYIDQLDVDLGNFTHPELESELQSIVENKVVETIRDILAMNTSLRSKLYFNYSIQSKHEKHWDLYIHFLQHGHMPWNFKRLSTQAFADFLNELSFSSLDNSTIEKLLIVLNNVNARSRLLNQSPLYFVTRLVDRLIREKRPDVSKDLSNEKKLEALIFETKLSGSDIHAKRDDIFKDVNEIISGDHKNIHDEFEGIYIENAGLILLHPFLPQLFNALEIVHESEIDFPDKALSILFYLAKGEDEIEEWDLVLPKLLCDLPLEHVFLKNHISDFEKEECDAMLHALINHWSALRNTSVEGLRNTFLLRPGKVGWNEGEESRLHVESKTYDVLLDQLPWGFTRIQLPWMKDMMLVEWGSHSAF